MGFVTEEGREDSHGGRLGGGVGRGRGLEDTHGGNKGFLEVVKEGQESQLLTAVAPPPPSEAAHTCVVHPGTQRKGERLAKSCQE